MKGALEKRKKMMSDKQFLEERDAKRRNIIGSLAFKKNYENFNDSNQGSKLIRMNKSED